MRLARFIIKRIVYTIPQLVVLSFITFVLLRVLPGNPAYQFGGPFSSEKTLKAVEAYLGLDQPIHVQYLQYVGRLLHGDLGDSWFTTRPVLEELTARLPATIELITLASLVLIVGGIAIGAVAGLLPGGIVERLARLYGSLAGAFPDFWLGLVLSFVFFFSLGWFPSPFGRLGAEVEPPTHITGMYTIDSLLTADWEALGSALGHLALPVLTLVVVYMGAIVKMTQSTVVEMLRSPFVMYARACGLPDRLVLRYALRNSLPPVVVLIGLTYGFLIGGAVLVENVFSWGGLGSYAVASVSRSDYFPIQAFVLLLAILNLLIYLVVDLVHFAMDPRVEY